MKKVFIFLIFSVLTSLVFAGNIDPKNENTKYCWSENAGWLSFKTDFSAVNVYQDRLEGHVFSENLGWINLSPQNGFGGVINDGNGNLSGFAWGENIGWINFAPITVVDQEQYQVKISPDGRFSGFAWSENIGWINFNLEADSVQVCIVNFNHLANFANHWLTIDASADLNGSGVVDYDDLSMLAQNWLNYCPDSLVIN